MPKIKKKIDQDDSDNDDSDDSQNQLKINTDNSPKIIPVAKLPDKIKYKKIVLNVSDTQYPIITQVGEQLGWIIEEEEGAGDWDVWWTDREIEPNTLYRMNMHQKINHFPGIYVLARKNLLGLHLMAMQKKFPNDYNFFPQTWMLPMQFPQFRQYYESIDEGKTRTYIVKPQALSQGRGIFLTRNIEDVINGRKYVVQRYIKNPLLLDGLKFDLRIYVLLGGSDPLRIYIYQEGLARLATRPYQQPTAQNLHQNYIHLTNYSLNKSNPDYIFNKSDQEMDVGHKRSIKAVYERLAKTGIDIQKLKQQIEDCIVKTVISGLPSIRHQYQYCQPEEYQSNMCFHILGFDVMILDDLKPIVIEVNHTPSFETATPLDYMIKKNLIKDTLKLMRITSEQKKFLFQKSKELTKKRVQTGKREILKGQERKVQLQKCQKIRQQEQEQILFDPQKPSGYKVIFPFKDLKKRQQFTKFQEGAEQVMRELKDMRKKIISEQNLSMKKQSPLPGTNKQIKSVKNSSIKQGSIQRSNNKKTSITVISSQKQQRASQKINSNLNKEIERENKVLESRGNEQIQNERRKVQLDTIIQHQEQGKIKETIQIDLKQQSTTTEPCHQSDKRTIFSTSGKNFQIRNDKNKKITNTNHINTITNFNPNTNINTSQKKHSSSFTPQQQPTRKNQSSTKYQELMNKFLKSKDLDDEHSLDQRFSFEGRALLEEKFSNLTLGHGSRNSHQEIVPAKDSMAAQLFAQIKQKNPPKNNSTITSSIKGYKQKVIAIMEPQSQKEKFRDSHIIKNPNKTSNGKRNYGSTHPLNMNIINITTKPMLMQNLSANYDFSEQQINSSNHKDSKKQKLDISKFGIFVKPKTYNLHQTKFPHQSKHIVRMQPNVNFVTNHKSQTEGLNGHGSMLNHHHSNGHHSNFTNCLIPTDKSLIARTKISISKQNNLSSINGKPSTSHKYKSNSLICKVKSIPLKETSIFFKAIPKVQGYQ